MVQRLVCLRCGYDWEPKIHGGRLPVQCPRCKRYDYQKEVVVDGEKANN